MSSAKKDTAAGKSADEKNTLAVEWLLEREQGFRAGRAEAFRAWCAADPRNAIAVAKAESIMGLLGGIPEWEEPLMAQLAEGEMPAPERKKRRWWPAVAVAASVALAFAALWWRGVPVGQPAEDINYVSGANSPQQVMLGDGSLVDLNASTIIRLRMLPHERRVALSEGEAHFEVAPDASRPFVVEAGGVTVRAIGTAFNVRMSRTGIEVLVTEGRVEVADVRSRDAKKPAGKSPRVDALERATVSRDPQAAGVVVEKVNRQTLQQELAWRSSVTNLPNRPLREIVTLFNRHNPVQLVIADAELGGRNIGGAFPIDQPQIFVRLLELDGDVVAERRGEKEIILHRKR